MAVQKQEAAQKKMEEAREIERKTKVYALPMSSACCHLFHRQSLCCQTKPSAVCHGVPQEARANLIQRQSKRISEEMAKKRVAQGDCVTRLTNDATEKAERLKMLEREARQKEEALLTPRSFVSAGSKKILSEGIRDGQTLAERTEAMLERKRQAVQDQLAKEEEEVLSRTPPATVNTETVDRLVKGRSDKDVDKRQRLQEQAEEQLRASIQVNCTLCFALCADNRSDSLAVLDCQFTKRVLFQVRTFISDGSKKILEGGLKDGGTLAERTEAMLERKKKAAQEQQAKEEQELRRGRESLKKMLSISRASIATCRQADNCALGARPSTAPVRRTSPRRSFPPDVSAKRAAQKTRTQAHELHDTPNGLVENAGTKPRNHVVIKRAEEQEATGPIGRATKSEAQVLIAEQREKIRAQQTEISKRDKVIEDLQSQLSHLADKFEELRLAVDAKLLEADVSDQTDKVVIKKKGPPPSNLCEDTVRTEGTLLDRFEGGHI